MRVSRLMLAGLLALSCAACGPKGGEGSEEEEGGDDSSGDLGEGGEEAGGPARVTVKILVDDAQARGRVRVLSASGQVEAQGQSGETFTVRSGPHTIEGSITDESVLIDKPTQTVEVDLAGGSEPQVETVEFARARVRLHVMRGRSEISGTQITLMREGTTDAVLTIRPRNQHIPISAGRYEADVKMGRDTVHVTGLQFAAGATQDIPINVRMENH